MQQFLVYLESNGEILRSFSGPRADADRQLAGGEALVEGVGNWTTHVVVAGSLVELESPRVPSETLSWDPHTASWVDPMLDPRTRAQAAWVRREVLLNRLKEAEGRQARPLRELQVARSLSRPDPEEALSALARIEAEITAMRGELQALPSSP